MPLKTQLPITQKKLLDVITDAAYKARMAEGQITFKSGDSASDIASKAAKAFSEKFAEVFAPSLASAISDMITNTLYTPIQAGGVVSSIKPT